MQIYYKASVKGVSKEHASGAAKLLNATIEGDLLILPHGMTGERMREILGLLARGIYMVAS